MKLTRVTIALWMGLVFVCGGVLGALGHRLYTVSSVRANNGGSLRRNAEEYRQRFTAELKSRLHLTDDQLSKMEAVLDDTRMKVREARVALDPEMKKIRDGQEAQIREILSDEQEAEWSKMQQERAAEREARRNQRKRTTPTQ
jgi:hypothetical protein